AWFGQERREAEGSDPLTAPGEHDQQVGHRRVRDERLRPLEHPSTVAARRLAAQGERVRAGVRLGDGVAPDQRTVAQAREPPALLLGGPVRHQRAHARPHVRVHREDQPGVRAAVAERLQRQHRPDRVHAPAPEVRRCWEALDPETAAGVPRVPVEDLLRVPLAGVVRQRQREALDRGVELDLLGTEPLDQRLGWHRRTGQALTFLLISRSMSATLRKLSTVTSESSTNTSNSSSMYDTSCISPRESRIPPSSWVSSERSAGVSSNMISSEMKPLMRVPMSLTSNLLGFVTATALRRPEAPPRTGRSIPDG